MKRPSVKRVRQIYSEKVAKANPGFLYNPDGVRGRLLVDDLMERVVSTLKTEGFTEKQAWWLIDDHNNNKAVAQIEAAKNPVT